MFEQSLLNLNKLHHQFQADQTLFLFRNHTLEHSLQCATLPAQECNSLPFSESLSWQKHPFLQWQIFDFKQTTFAGVHLFTSNFCYIKPVTEFERPPPPF